MLKSILLLIFTTLHMLMDRQCIYSMWLLLHVLSTRGTSNTHLFVLNMVEVLPMVFGWYLRENTTKKFWNLYRSFQFD